MTPTRYLFVLNPAAGRGRASQRWPRVADLLLKKGLRAELLVSEPHSRDEVIARVRALPEGVAVVAVGGDGTIRSLLPAVVGTGRPLGIVPLGRGNDLAAALGWRVSAVWDAVEHLQRPPVPIDVLGVRLHGRDHLCLNGLGAGFDAQVTARAARTPKSLGGLGQYALGALLSVRELQTGMLEVIVDGRSVFRGESFLCAVMNSTRYGGGFYISPLSDVADARADVLIGCRVSRAALVPLLLRVLRGRHLGHPKVVYRRGRTVTLRWDKPMQVHLDGDLFPPADRLHVRLIPAGVNLLGYS